MPYYCMSLAFAVSCVSHTIKNNGGKGAGLNVLNMSYASRTHLSASSADLRFLAYITVDLKLIAL